jgi:hypothetical protein
MSIPIDFDSAQAMLKITKSKLQMLYRWWRPYSSDMGAMISGPIANPRIYTDTTKVAMVFEVSWKVRRTWGTPGAKKDEARGVMSVTAPRAAIMPHFREAAQFCGLAGSSGPSQSTRLGSRGSGGSCMDASPERVRSSVWVDWV